MKKIDGNSLDLDMDNISKLTDFFDEHKEDFFQIFPEIESEGKIDFEKLRLILGDEVEESEERYNFTWHGKRDAIRLAQTPTTGTLRPDKDNSKNWDETENIYIEGDNLEVLKILQKSYHGKIKMIYIDPPYNTGNDIIYKNDFSDPIGYYKAFTGQIDSKGYNISTNTESDGKFHTNWLNLMYPRLRLARNLLIDNGFFAISIDHNELFNIGSVCDEIFGEDNRIGIISVVHKPEGRNQAKYIGPSNEFMLIYIKDDKKAKIRQVAIDEKQISSFDKRDEKGAYRLKNFIRLSDGKYSLRSAKPEFWYPIWVSKDYTYLSVNEFDDGIPIYPVTKTGVERTWKTTKTTCQERIKDNDIVVCLENDEVCIYEKLRENEVIKTHWINKKYHGFHFGTKIIDDLLNVKTFDFPKSLYLMRDILKLFTEKDDIILDFFSGSATTAHAVMDLNAEDGGNRKYIMVQLPEPTDEKSEAFKAGYKTIADIGRERIRRAGEKILEDNKDKEGIEDLDIGFKAFKLDSSNIKEWNPDFMDKELDILDLVDNFVEGREEKDILYEIILKYGIDLSTPIEEHKVDKKTIYSVGFGSVYVALDKDIDDKLVQKILELKREDNMPNPIVVFRDNGFKDDQVKLNAKLTLQDNGIEEVVSI